MIVEVGAYQMIVEVSAYRMIVEVGAYQMIVEVSAYQMIVEVGVLLFGTDVASVEQDGEAKRLKMAQVLLPKNKITRQLTKKQAMISLQGMAEF